MSTNLNSPLRWMDAVAQERAASATAMPTLDDLTQTITAFHAEQGLPLTPAEARGAAQRCLAQPQRAVSAVQVPWDRPTSRPAWEAKRNRLARQTAVLKRLRDWPVAVTVAMMGVLSLGGAGAMYRWTGTTDLVPIGLVMGLVMQVLTEGLVNTSAKVAHVKRTEQQRRLQPFAPGEQDTQAISAWMKIPRMAHWLAQLRHGEVPWLQGDLEELRSRAHAEAEAVCQSHRTEAFLRHLDGQLSVSCAQAVEVQQALA